MTQAAREREAVDTERGAERMEEVRAGAAVEAVMPIGSAYRRTARAAARAGERAPAAGAELARLCIPETGSSQSAVAGELIAQGEASALVAALVAAHAPPETLALARAVADEPAGDRRLVEMIDGSVLALGGETPEVVRGNSTQAR